MFLTCKLEDSVRVQPSELGKDTLEAVEAVLEATYLDRIVPDCGLVVSNFEVNKIEGGFIYHSEGAVHFNVQFTLAIFRPLLGELMTGDGIWVSLGFFEDVFVPEYCLQNPSVFDTKDGAWFWEFEGNKMYIDEGSEVRLRVKDVKFNAVPTVKQLKARGEELLGTIAKPFTPMEVTGAMNSDGLGCVEWWIPPEGEDMDED